MADKLKYEPPRLVEFNDQIQQSKGLCSTGSGDTGDCDGNGMSAGGGCWADGLNASGGCTALGNIG